MLRAVRIPLPHLTARKRRMIEEIACQYRAAVNYYIRRLWRREKVRWDDLLPHTRLSARYVSAAFRHAKSLVKSVRSRKGRKSMPRFRGYPVLDAKFVTIEGSLHIRFDYVLRLSTLKKGSRMALPFNGHKWLRRWLEKPGASLRNGCVLKPDAVILWVELPDQPPKEEGRPLAVDIGLDRLLVTSDGEVLDEGEHKRIVQKLARKRPGSKARRRAAAHRRNHIGQVVNRIPWKEINVLVVEDLKHLKRGKRPDRGKTFRKALSPWAYRQVLARLRQKAQEHRVLLVAVDPRHTSRKCPVCGTESKENRKGAVFRCVGCDHSGNADKVGATNILHRYLSGSARSQSPGCWKTR